MKFFKVKILLLTVITLNSGCSQKKVSLAPDVIPMKQMEEVMTDVQLAEAAKQISAITNTPNQTINYYYSFIFKSHHITKEQFQRSLDFYTSHPELMEEIYTAVINRLSEMQTKPINHN